MKNQSTNVPPELVAIGSYAHKWGLSGEPTRNRFVLSQSREAIEEMTRQVEPYLARIMDWLAERPPEDETTEYDVYLCLYFAWEFSTWLLRHWEDREALSKQYGNQ